MGTQQYVWVGLFPVETPATKPKENQRGSHVIGLQETASMLTFGLAKTTKVVTPMLQKSDADIKLYVLLAPTEGSSTPHIISLDKVYFFAEFREESTSKRDRGHPWVGKVKEAALIS